MRMPRPQQMPSDNQPVRVDPLSTISLHGDCRQALAAWLDEWGVTPADDGDIVVTATLDTGAEFCYNPAVRRMTDERYRLHTESRAGKILVKITGASRRALRYGVNAVVKMLADGVIYLGDIDDYPAFERRGVIEGFYGRPWPNEARKSLLTLIARHNMNTYFYGPKNDVYHREKWGCLHDETSLAKIAQLARWADDCDIDLFYCMGPGLTIRYAGDEDLQKLVDKVRQVHSVGVRRFSLFLDDIPPILQHPADNQRYGDLVEAHIDIVCRYRDAVRAIDDDITVAVCPQQYHGRGDEEYITRLGRGIPADILLMWTGPDICSKELTLRDAMAFESATGHRPLYWDNYPVNDANMTREMHLGPIIGREPGLERCSAGLVANGMESLECSKIPFITIAAWLWNPTAYVADAAWRQALREVAGERDWQQLMLVADNLRNSCLRDQNAYTLGRSLYIARFLLMAGDVDAAVAQLDEYLAQLTGVEQMLVSGMENVELQRELAPWFAKHRLMDALLRDCREYLAAPDEAKREDIKQKQAQYNEQCAVYADFALEEFVDLIIGKYR